MLRICAPTRLRLTLPLASLRLTVTCFAAFGGFLYGYDTGYIGGVKEMPWWLDQFGEFNAAQGKNVLSSGNSSLVTSILSVGTFFGALGAYPAGDALGRRWGIIAYLCLFAIGVALQTVGTTIPIFTVGRVFAGLGVGGTSCLVPMYQSECAPKSVRGLIVSAYQWMITIGLLIAAVIVNATKDINGPACFRIPIGIQFAWAAILATGLAIFPESPRYLIMKGHEEKAQRALSRILGAPVDSPEVMEEYAEIASNLHHERSLGKSTYLDCFRNNEGRYGLRMWTGIGIQALQQLSGVNFIFYYGTTFFKQSGISNSFLITIATSVVNVGMTIPGMLAVDRSGRRFLLLTGAVVMATSQLIVAIVGTIIGNGNAAGQKVLIAFVCIFIGAFAATWGPMAWVVTGEIYPNAIRAKAMSMSTASNWLLNFVIGYVTPYMVDSGPGNANLGAKVFFIWGGFCVICFFFVYFCIPETMGLSLEQVDILYRNSSILKSNQFRKQILSENIHDDTIEAYATQTKAGKGEAEHVEKRDF